MPETTNGLNELTLALLEDMRQLRNGQITNTDARTRAQLAREILRATHLMLQGIAIEEKHLDAKKQLETK